jgi:hypothetical protein
MGQSIHLRRKIAREELIFPQQATANQPSGGCDPGYTPIDL